MENITNIIKIESSPSLKMSPDGDFFKAWVEFTKPIHKLARREMEVLAALLKERYELSKGIIREDILDSVLMDRDTKRKIRLSCNMKPKHFQIVMTKLKHNGVIKDGKIYLNLIPSITEEGAGLMIYFDFKNEQRIKLGPSSGIKSPQC